MGSGIQSFNVQVHLGFGGALTLLLCIIADLGSTGFGFNILNEVQDFITGFLEQIQGYCMCAWCKESIVYLVWMSYEVV
jgi:hypothetical protein